MEAVFPSFLGVPEVHGFGLWRAGPLHTETHLDLKGGWMSYLVNFCLRGKEGWCRNGYSGPQFAECSWVANLSWEGKVRSHCDISEFRVAKKILSKRKYLILSLYFKDYKYILFKYILYMFYIHIYINIYLFKYIYICSIYIYMHKHIYINNICIFT